MTVESDLWERLKELAYQRWGFLKGSLSKELENAIKTYLDSRHATTSIIKHEHNKIDPKKRTRKAFEHLVRCLESTYEADIPARELEEFVAKTLNVSDRRTIRKYIILLEQERIIVRRNLYIYRMGKAPAIEVV
jgi:hypothetical protein